MRSRFVRPVLVALLAAALAGCGGRSQHSAPPPVAPSLSSSIAPTSPAPSHPAPSTRTASVRPPARTSSTQAPPSGNGPVIVIDPGHSVTVHAVDPATGLDVSDYENEPEMHDVFVVAELVRKLLVDDGYRVVLTKPTLDTPTSLLRRAQIADASHAALALSIHDQAGSSGGIGFTQGNNTVYYPSVGDYRETPTGRKVYYTDASVAARSRRYGLIFQAKRSAVEGVPVTLLGNTGYDLGSRGLPAGDIWLVQLLSHVPWIYNEAGGNSAGMVGLSPADEQRYARALAVAVEACVPTRG